MVILLFPSPMSISNQSWKRGFCFAFGNRAYFVKGILIAEYRNCLTRHVSYKYGIRPEHSLLAQFHGDLACDRELFRFPDCLGSLTFVRPFWEYGQWQRTILLESIIRSTNLTKQQHQPKDQCKKCTMRSSRTKKHWHKRSSTKRTVSNIRYWSWLYTVI